MNTNTGKTSAEYTSKNASKHADDIEKNLSHDFIAAKKAVMSPAVKLDKRTPQ
jgi:hypothetical protein